MVVRNIRGDVKSYPVVETLQTDNICHCVLAPANTSLAVQHEAAKVHCNENRVGHVLPAT